jgi:hypothetical protein
MVLLNSLLERNFSALLSSCERLIAGSSRIAITQYLIPIPYLKNLTGFVRCWLNNSLTLLCRQRKIRFVNGELQICFVYLFIDKSNSLEPNMKKHGLILFLLMALVMLCGCAKNPNANQPTTPVSTANANSSPGQNPNDNTPAKPAEPTLPPQALLQGTYAISEVQHDGMVEMISSANTTEITFKPPSAFYRTSKKEGKSDFKDNGQYKIEGKDKLILTILMSNDKMQLKPVSKQHTFSISPTGDELKLTSSKGNTAVFLRIRNN